MPLEKQSLPVWYFIGWLLLIYGILIVGAGTGVFAADSPSVSADSRIGVWWGAFLMAIGLGYVCCFRPRRRGGRDSR